VLENGGVMRAVRALLLMEKPVRQTSPDKITS